VLPPISTRGWKVSQLDERIESIRDKFAQTLEEWPA
jgi:hypothetical protein